MYIPTQNPSSLELTIALPGISSSGGHAMSRDYLDINQVPSSGGSEERCNDEEEEDSPTRHKKLRLTREQSLMLEQNYRQNHILNPDQKAALATELNLKPRQVEVWFQNRRARSKVKQTETEFEYLKRWVVTLTEQNKRLQQELEDLRTIRARGEGPSRGLLDYSPSNLSLTMCPGCERVAHVTTSITTDVSSADNEAFLTPRKSATFHNS